MKRSIKAIFRRGPSTKAEGQSQTPENLSRASSVSNLDPVDSRNKGGAKPKKVSSREKLSRPVDRDLEDQEGVSRNNNKLETSVEVLPFDESVQETSVLQKKLQEMASEKSNLIIQLNEQKGQLAIMQVEITKLKDYHDQMMQLHEENQMLRNRLHDIAHSPLSDAEKEQLLYESQEYQSAPLPTQETMTVTEEQSTDSAVTIGIEGGEGDMTASLTSEQNRQSSSGTNSDISVACLQDKIHQMQETHYSTNEELQATLQELSDLQRQLTDLQFLTDRLTEEKTLMFDSLCRQTERLNLARQDVEVLRGELESTGTSEQRLLELLKDAQLERDHLLSHQERLAGELEEARRRLREVEGQFERDREERQRLREELEEIREVCTAKEIEGDKLRDMLHATKVKLEEIEQERRVTEKSEMEEVLDKARKEKDSLESEIADLREQLTRSRNEVKKLCQQVSVLQEECKVIRNNAKTAHSDLEYRNEKLLVEKNSLAEQLRHFQEALGDYQLQIQYHLDEKRQLSVVLAETQRNLVEAESRIIQLEDELAEVQKLRKDENEEWEKFQNDLLTSVRVANEFKTEAQQDLQKMILENKAHREKVKQLENQINKLKGMNSVSRSSSTSSVNSLISDLRSPSGHPSVMGSLSLSPSSSLKKSPPDWPEIISNKSPHKEHQPNKLKIDWNKTTTHIKESFVKEDLNKSKMEELVATSRDSPSSIPKALERHQQPQQQQQRRPSSTGSLSTEPQPSSPCERKEKDPLNGLVKNGGSRRNALLKWCQNKTVGYRNIDITNFSSSWTDGLALCAILHTYLPDKIPYDTLTPQNKRRNFSLAFSAAESVGIPTTLKINDMVLLERPDWQQVMAYVTSIYKHFET